MRGTDFRMLVTAMKPPSFVGSGLAAARFMRLLSLVSLFQARKTSATVPNCCQQVFKIRAIEDGPTRR